MEADSGMYIAEELPVFNNRQAWVETLPGSFSDFYMRASGNELLHISSTKPKERLSRHSAEMSMIREVVETGTLGLVGSLWNVASLKDQLKAEYDRLLPSDALQYQAIHALDALDTAVERAAASARIIRAAGCIAVRSNLWVVTRLTSQGEDKRISAARLTGLAKNKDDETPIRVLPVVTGKNGVTAVLKNADRDPAKNVRPNVLDVIESNRAR